MQRNSLCNTNKQERLGGELSDHIRPARVLKKRDVSHMAILCRSYSKPYSGIRDRTPSPQAQIFKHPTHGRL